MRGFICFLAACAVYILGGLLIWYIVCSMIDVPSSTIEELEEYRLYSYAGFAALTTFVILLFSNESEKTYEILLGAILISFLIGIAANSWDLSSGAATILSIIYNIINIGAVTFSFYCVSNKS